MDLVVTTSWHFGPLLGEDMTEDLVDVACRFRVEGLRLRLNWMKDSSVLVVSSSWHFGPLPGEEMADDSVDVAV